MLPPYAFNILRGLFEQPAVSSPVEWLGWIAGSMLLASNIPQLFANFKNPDLARHQSRGRNALQASGNAVWCIYAVLKSLAPMIFFAALGCGTALALLVQTVRARRGRQEKDQNKKDQTHQQPTRKWG